MWNHSSKMSSSASPLPIAQPWTPPETDIDSSPRPDYFSDPFKPASNFSEEDLDSRWPLSPSTPELIRRMSKPREVSGDPPKSRPNPISSATEPYTPTKSVNLHNLNSSGALQYPYTPDSSRVLRANTQPVTPLAPSPWISDTSSPRSPVQSALSSCMIHMENLIQTRQPNDDQMEFIVAQFETMASYLSAPESQTKKTDDHLFSEPEPASTNDVANGSANGLGITTTGSNEINSNLVSNGDKPVTEVTDLSEEYVREVGKYIAGVQKSAEDLKMRLDEVKQLNGIQVDIINDLRRELRHVYEQLEKQKHNSMELNTSPAEQNCNAAEVDDEEDQVKIDDVSETKTPRRRRRIIIVRKKQQSGFWASIGNAVDAMSDMLLDW